MSWTTTAYRLLASIFASVTFTMFSHCWVVGETMLRCYGRWGNDFDNACRAVAAFFGGLGGFGMIHLFASGDFWSDALAGLLLLVMVLKILAMIIVVMLTTLVVGTLATAVFGLPLLACLCFLLDKSNQKH